MNTNMQKSNLNKDGCRCFWDMFLRYLKRDFEKNRITKKEVKMLFAIPDENIILNSEEEI